MLSNKFLVMSFALFAVIIAVSGEEISDRRFRWVGSDEQESDEKKAEVEEDSANDNDVEDEEDTIEAQDDDADDNETQDDDETGENNDSEGDNTEEDA